MTVYAPPGHPGSPADVQARYDNWIGGEFVAPVDGRYFENPRHRWADCPPPGRRADC